ncbi:hypothetical protein GLAREA_03503 [Glarea lozoyensis ATCC 20868]|uniref:Uncharacterized protein n=1 Tax=Glarea lozoyensis (strain ATCC 20868 / MF5171) TaxID=1116229 RepID=S3DEX0_GLAL2|nr:uncharacterized protein GLAREA_03503 [Glarea lozoyensis ATCC 20868]EPE30536.1 hypothetical protein GLAREA_03503 [Glarea lozoyensis ATCC 20868]
MESYNKGMCQPIRLTAFDDSLLQVSRSRKEDGHAGFELKMVRHVPMYFSPSDTLYFDDLETMQSFLTSDARCSIPQTLNNSSILSVAIGRFSVVRNDSKERIILSSFCETKPWAEPDKRAIAAVYLAKLFNLEELILLIDGMDDMDWIETYEHDGRFTWNPCSKRYQLHSAQDSESVNNQPATSIETISRETLTAFKSAFELSLSKSSGPVLEALSNQRQKLYGVSRLRLPFQASAWWKNPSVTIKKGSAYRFRHSIPAFSNNIELDVFLEMKNNNL